MRGASIPSSDTLAVRFARAVLGVLLLAALVLPALVPQAGTPAAAPAILADAAALKALAPGPPLWAKDPVAAADASPDAVLPAPRTAAEDAAEGRRSGVDEGSAFVRHPPSRPASQGPPPPA